MPVSYLAWGGGGQLLLPRELELINSALIDRAYRWLCYCSLWSRKPDPPTSARIASRLIGSNSLFTLAWNGYEPVHGIVLKNGSASIYTSHHNRCVYHTRGLVPS